MKTKSLLFVSILSVLTSCSGQAVPQAGHTVRSAEHPTATTLSNNIMVVYQDKQNNYWFGSWKDGVYKYDGHTLTHFTTQDGLPANRIDEIKEDKQGNIYFTTGNGICQYNGEQFITLREAVIDNGVWKLNPDDLWFKNAQYDGYVYRYNGSSLCKLRLPPNDITEDFIRKNPRGPSPYGVYTIYKDSKGSIWLGTAAAGACRYNGTTFNWITEEDVTELHNGPSNGVRSIAEDKKGDFWFNTNYRYRIYGSDTAGSGKFYNRIKSIGNLDGGSDNGLSEYLSVVKDNDDNLWIATYDDGVWKYDGAKVTRYPIQVNAKDITVFCIYKDNAGKLWLGTHEKGVWRFDGKEFEKVSL